MPFWYLRTGRRYVVRTETLAAQLLITNSSYKGPSIILESRATLDGGQLWLDLNIALLQPFLTACLEYAHYPSHRIIHSLAKILGPDLA